LPTPPEVGNDDDEESGVGRLTPVCWWTLAGAGDIDFRRREEKSRAVHAKRAAASGGRMKWQKYRHAGEETSCNHATSKTASDSKSQGMVT
jgi:hypothetical protein